MSIYYKLVGHKNRVTYWGCSEFARQIQKMVGMIPKPFSETSKGWHEWTVANKKSHQNWYWITEEGLDMVQNIVYFPYDVYSNFYYWFRSAYITQPHVIRTGLEKGGWYDIDTRMQAGLFNLVIEFVEIDKAYHSDLVRDRKMMSKLIDREKAGLEYLDWEIGLGEESPYQSKDAQEIKEIYLWIKHTRPSRPDPHAVSGWGTYCDNKDDLFSEEETDEKKQHVKDMLNHSHKLESDYEQEDTQMLTRIVINRMGMWT